MDVQRYQKQDLSAAMNLMNIHMAKLTKAVESNSYPEACSALRAIQDECNNASKVAATLSLSSHLNDQRR
ncbi:hypothetical protein CBP51_16950 [Cellvibrio mixtus]|uniref:Uncharacterized protein n=1 Tax=Cellvibrio mixtus TaxID=39650 RepID=A0A266Q689_9GAMM|nr:hypothetical protein [Cellvibrio mixtus]OZY84849.1 hypothetical protein CBP51_16950 [Cellvibrio mixtus]